jgi:DNA-binding CsgD family transcriptional regulator
LALGGEDRWLGLLKMDAFRVTKADADAARAMHSLSFRFRLCSRADLAYCAELLPAGFRASPPVRRQLIALWDRLLASDARTFCIIEDLERAHPANIEAFGLSVFVTDRFIAEFCASPRPYVSALFYERMLAGEDVILTREQLPLANSATGINVLAMHFGLRNEDLSHARTAQALAAGTAAFYFLHGGYRINTLINEVYGAQAARYVETGGFRLVRDFQRALPAEFAGVPADQHPYLFMLRRDWVAPGAVSPLSLLFSAPMPRIFFTATERCVLERALLNETDAHIAECLGISIDGVKKAWRNIYGRVSRRAPHVVPASDLGLSGSRGAEKRRHLLDYLRTHLEELRPAIPPDVPRRHPCPQGRKR